MIEFLVGDIFESDCEVIINPVNCYGKMGRGLALQFKQNFPSMFLSYKKACDEGNVKIGKMHTWKNPTGGWIVNFPTKDHWRNPSKLEWIVDGLQDLITFIKSQSIQSIALPALGAGLGGLPFYLVKNEIKKVHDQHWNDIKVVVYEKDK